MLIDTNIFSFILNGGSRAKLVGRHLDGKLAALSFQSVGELWYGAFKDGWGERRLNALEIALRQFVVLPFDAQTARIWGELRAQAERQGLTKQTADLWIAATAKRHNLPLLTDDRGFLTGLAVTVIQPDDPPAISES